MLIRHITLGLFAALIVALGAGCKKSESRGPSAPSASATSFAPSPATVARIHWLGKKRLGIEATAYYFMRVWELPESAKLEAQTLDKLASAPWRLARTERAGIPPTPDAPAVAGLRALLNDLVREESYLEIRQATNQPSELVFAIRLSDAQAGRWQTNLAAVLESLTGVRPAAAQDNLFVWSLSQLRPPHVIELVRVGEWTVVGTAQEKNGLLGEIVARIRRDRAPVLTAGTNFWLRADLDPRRTVQALGLGWNLPEDLPRISVSVTGDGGNVITRGELTFPEPLQVGFEPWTIPTNLIHEPLASFTAVRGFRPWLASWKAWNDLQMGAPPDQFYLWAGQGDPVRTWFAAPLAGASNQVQRLAEHLMEKSNPWLAARGYVSFERAQDANGVTWGRLPSGLPFIKSVGGDGGFVFGGLSPDVDGRTNRVPPVGLFQALVGRTNLVCYAWETTGPQIESCLYLGQVVRAVLRRAQLPLDSAGATWLGAVVPRLGDCVTVVTCTGTNQLAFSRKATVGFTAAELQMLADWLESPQFPVGLHTFLAPAEAPPGGAPQR